MTGNLYRGQAGLPFSSALRVYEPLEAFPEDQQGALRAAWHRAVPRAAVENAELLASLGRITRPDGDPFPTGATDLVRVVAVPRTGPTPAAGPADAGAADAGSPERLLYCPSQLVLRAGLAANALMEGIHGPLAALLIP
jgi:hypothetical protein